MKPIDLTGKVYGRLKVIKLDKMAKTVNRKWICECNCGNIVSVAGNNLKNGHTQSCGCILREKQRNKFYKHGMSKTKIYSVWRTMKQRCTYEKNESYKNYGGRGITYCDEWEEFEPFYEWAMANGYKEGLSIDRIDSDGNYEPSNCRWVTMKKQQNNRTNNRIIKYKNKEMNLQQFIKLTGLTESAVRGRLDRGWSVEDIANTPMIK